MPPYSETPFTATTLVDRPRQIAFDAAGDVVIADENADRPIRLDPDTGTDVAMLTTTPFDFLWGAAVEPSGMALFTDFNTGLVSRIDEAGDTATPINFGHAETGIAHLAAVPDDYDLTVELTDNILVDGGDPGVADVGDTLELTAVVTNTGAGSADLLSLESGLDPNLTLVAGSLSTTQGSIIEGSLASDPRLEVDLGTLAPAASATVTWEVVVSDPAPDTFVTANAWIRREKLILAESDDPTTGPLPDPNVIGVGDYGVFVQAVQKLSDTRGGLSGAGNPGSLLLDGGQFAGVENLGDIDADGVTDIAVGADFDSEAGAASGALYIFLLNADGTVKDRFKWTATEAGLPMGSSDRFGSAVAPLGDLDGAGGSDFALAVGAWEDPGVGGVQRGAVYVLFMDTDFANPDPALRIQIGSITEIGDGVGGFGAGLLDNGDFFGQDIEAIGDVDDDGVMDLAVGAHRDDDGGASRGAVWILFLNTDGTVASYTKISDSVAGGFDGVLADGDHFGFGLAGLGLFDGDTVPDLAIGAIRRAGGGTDRGTVFIVTLNADGTVKSRTELAPGLNGFPIDLLEDDDRFGRGLEVLPDLDGDGVVELGVGANRDSDAAVRAGTAYVVFLTDTPIGVDRVVPLTPELSGFPSELDEEDRYGIELAYLGDLDGDSQPEIAVGALRDDDGGTDRGAVYVLYTVPEPGFGLGLAVSVGVLAALRRRTRGVRTSLSA